MSELIQQHTLGQLFERAIQIENQAGSIYREMEKRFSHHPVSAALWKVMAADEDVHARILRQIYEGASPERLSQPSPPEAWVSISDIYKLVNQDSLDSVETLQDAYELAHQLEHSEVNAIFEFLSLEVVPNAIERDFVRSHIVRHQGRLLEFRQGISRLDMMGVRSR